MAASLVEYLDASAARHPDRIALVDPDGASLTYAELAANAAAFAAWLRAHGVQPGDRVGVVLPKGNDAVVALFGAMMARAAYVPVDVTAPIERCRRILADCRVRAVVAAPRALSAVPGPAADGPVAVVVAGGGGSAPLPEAATPFEDALAWPPAGAVDPPTPDDLAYILYTSGSTGMPKGVMLSHRNALGFVDWCSDVFGPTADDRFSSHAPFHFDLSVLDIYVCVKHGATLYLIGEELGKNPKELARHIARHRLTVWYSTPSILTLLKQFGGLESLDCSSLRLVLFAGEVFPVKHLRELQQLWPTPVYYNLYGPTETNVCTYARIPSNIPPSRESPYPIGWPCSHCDALVLDDGGAPVSRGEEGLLYIAGPSVFQGYWNRPAENAAAFVERDGRRWYNTGDVVREDLEDGFIYLGRRDRMVKRRGYRIELGEIERALYLHPAVREAAVIAVPDPEGVRIAAFLSVRTGEAPPGVIQLKTFCAAHLPSYMSPDRFEIVDALPRTSTDKVDYQGLKARMAAPELT